MADNRVQITIAALDQTRAAFDSVRKGFKSIDAQSRSSVSSITADWKKAAAAVGTVFSAYQAAAFVKDVISSQVAMDRLNVAMESALGSSQASGDSMSYVRAEAQRLGLSLQESAQGYIKIAAAAKGTALEGEPVKQIFTAVSEAATALSLTAEDTNGALLAISQMMSKGKVSAEELRGQLGERLPGAFQVAAKAMGVTTAQLDKMLQAGNIMSDDFLPKFAAALRQHYSGAIEKVSQSSSANLNRMKTAIFDFKVALGEAFGSATTDSVKAITTAFERFKTEIAKPEAQEAIKRLSDELANFIIKAGEEAPQAIAKILSSLNGLMTFYQTLPGWVIEAGSMGLVGKILFGNKVGVILASISAIKSGLESLTETEGKGNFGFEGLANYVKDLKNLWSGKGLDGKYGVTPKPTGIGLADPAGLAKAESKLLGSSAPAKGKPTANAPDKKMQSLLERWKDLKRQLEADISTAGLDDLDKKLADIDVKAAKYIDDFKKIPGAKGVIEKWAAAQKQDLRDEADEKSTKEAEERVQQQLENAKKLRQEMDELAGAYDPVIAAQVEYDKTLEKINQALVAGAISEEEWANAVARADVEKQVSILKQKNAVLEQSLEIQLKEIDLAEQAGAIHQDTLEKRLEILKQILAVSHADLDAMTKAGKKDSDAAAWYAQLQKVMEVYQRILGVQQGLKEANGTLGQGWTDYWKDYIAEAKSAYNAGKQLAADTANAMQNTFSSVFFDVIEGRFKGLHDYLVSFSHTINRAMADIAGQWVTGKLTAMLGIGGEQSVQTMNVTTLNVAGGIGGKGAGAGTGTGTGTETEKVQTGFLTTVGTGLDNLLAKYTGYQGTLFTDLGTKLGGLFGQLGGLLANLFSGGGVASVTANAGNGGLWGLAGNLLAGNWGGAANAASGSGSGSSYSGPSGYTDTGAGYSSNSSFGTGSGSTFGNFKINAMGQHAGGVGNEPTFYRVVPSSAFFGAPRYHSGIGPGEKAAILRTDEGVFTPGQMKNMASLSSIVSALKKSSASANGGNSMSVNVPVSVNSDNKQMIAALQSRIEATVIKTIKDFA